MKDKDLSKLCIHTITTKNWPLEKAIEKYGFEVEGLLKQDNFAQGKYFDFLC